MSEYKSVISLAIARKTPKEIAKITGLTRGSVYAYISKARAQGVNIPRFAGGGIAATDGTRLTVPRDVTMALRGHAQKRGMTTAAFANALLAEIVASDLVAAVMDDAEWLADALSDEGLSHA